ncbi:MAG: tripartite tricarboxylate transporter TctB family protein [Rhizobiaceae bacterium]
MQNLSDRIAGLLIFLCGLFVYTVLIPWQVETVEYGAMHPETMPKIIAVILAISGLVLIARPTAPITTIHMRWIRMAMFATVLFAGLFALTRFGFVYTAPPLALAIMLLIGERRPFWLFLGTAGTPLLIWFAVAYLLERPLP